MAEFSENREISTGGEGQSTNEASDRLKQINDAKLQLPEEESAPEKGAESPAENAEAETEDDRNKPLETENPSVENSANDDSRSEQVVDTNPYRYEPLGTTEETSDNPSGYTMRSDQINDAKLKLPEGERAPEKDNESSAENATTEIKDDHDKPLETENKDIDDADGNKNNEATDDKNSYNDKPLVGEELGYHEGKVSGYDENKSDLKNAKDDLAYAKKEKEAYIEAVKANKIPEDKKTLEQLDDAIKDAQDHLKEVKAGQPYSYERPSDYWESPKGRQMAGKIGAEVTDYAVGKVAEAFGVEVPSGETDVSGAAQNFGQFIGENYGYKAIGKTMDKGQDLMANAHETYTTPAEKFVNETFIMRDADGNPITAEQGRKLAFGEDD